MFLKNCTNFIYEGCVYDVKPQTAPSMYYDTNIHNLRRNSDLIILMLPSTEGWRVYVEPTGGCRPQGSLFEPNFRSQGSIFG